MKMPDQKRDRRAKPRRDSSTSEARPAVRDIERRCASGAVRGRRSSDCRAPDEAVHRDNGLNSFRWRTATISHQRESNDPGTRF